MGSKVAKLSRSGEGFPSINPSTATVTAACCSPANRFFTPAVVKQRQLCFRPSSRRPHFSFRPASAHISHVALILPSIFISRSPPPLFPAFLIPHSSIFPIFKPTHRHSLCPCGPHFPFSLCPQFPFHSVPLFPTSSFLMYLEPRSPQSLFPLSFPATFLIPKFCLLRAKPLRIQRICFDRHTLARSQQPQAPPHYNSREKKSNHPLQHGQARCADTVMFVFRHVHMPRRAPG